MKNFEKAMQEKPYAGNPHIRFDEGEITLAVTPRRGSLLYNAYDTGGRWKLHRATVLASVIMFALAGSGVDYYVNGATGSDSNNGSQTAPFKTIQKAMTTGRYQDQLIVHIAGGVYEPAHALYSTQSGPYTMSLLGEGTEQNPVVIDGGDTNSCFTLQNSNRRATFANIIFRNGRGYKGGGICCERGWTTDCVVGLTNCVFESCIATNGNGGAICSSYNSVKTEYSSCVFSNCTASVDGGALSLTIMYVDAVLEKCRFENCSAGNIAGAVCYSLSSGPVETNDMGLCVLDCVFTNNSATTQGGALSGNVRVASNTTFRTNRASEGGVWYLNGYKSSDFSGTYALTNTYVDCIFENNSADEYGGAFCFQWMKRFAFDKCVFRGNRAGTAGAVLSARHDNSYNMVRNLYVTDCVVESNESANSTFWLGPVLSVNAVKWADEHQIQFRRSRFAGNRTGTGAVIYNRERMLVDGCEFAANLGGRAIVNYYNSQDRMTNTVRNCLFHHNTNTVNSGIVFNFCYQAEASEMSNCSLVDNVSAEEPYAVYIDTWDTSSAGCIYANLIVSGNVSTNGATGKQVPPMLNTRAVNSFFDTGATTIADGTRGCVVGADPRFRDRAAFDYTTRGGSPCRDSGILFDWMEGTLDIRNDRRYPRVANGTPDMGCYEHTDYSGFRVDIK